jgi:4-hydroxybenzoate polyprenyltransferase
MIWEEFIVGFILFIGGIIMNFYMDKTLVGFMIGVGLSIMIYSYYDIKQKKKSK